MGIAAGGTMGPPDGATAGGGGRSVGGSRFNGLSTVGSIHWGVGPEGASMVAAFPVASVRSMGVAAPVAAPAAA